MLELKPEDPYSYLISIFCKLALEDIKLMDLKALEISNSGQSTTIKILMDAKYQMNLWTNISSCYPNCSDKEKQFLDVLDKQEENEKERF